MLTVCTAGYDPPATSGTNQWILPESFPSFLFHFFQQQRKPIWCIYSISGVVVALKCHLSTELDETMEWKQPKAFPCKLLDCSTDSESMYCIVTVVNKQYKNQYFVGFQVVQQKTVHHDTERSWVRLTTMPQTYVEGVKRAEQAVFSGWEGWRFSLPCQSVWQ